MSRADGCVRRVAADAAMLLLALMLSLVEALIPTALIPIPGFKLGLANIAVEYVFFAISPADAFAVSLARLTLSSLLFGTAASFVFSASGAAFAFLTLIICVAAVNRGVISWLGVSICAAAAHNIGQCAVSIIMFGAAAVSYLPWLLALGAATGCATGAVLCALAPRIDAAHDKFRINGDI